MQVRLCRSERAGQNVQSEWVGQKYQVRMRMSELAGQNAQVRMCRSEYAVQNAQVRMRMSECVCGGLREVD